LREDVELLRSLTSNVAIALESALASDSAEQYEREFATERDRIRLLPEINNHVVPKLCFQVHYSHKIGILAERVGFEPTVGFLLHTLSKRAP
jgi:hypothetical protein